MISQSNSIRNSSCRRLMLGAVVLSGIAEVRHLSRLKARHVKSISVIANCVLAVALFGIAAYLTAVIARDNPIHTVFSTRTFRTSAFSPLRPLTLDCPLTWSIGMTNAAQHQQSCYCQSYRPRK